MSIIYFMKIGEQISLTPIEVVMRDEWPKSIGIIDHNIIVSLQSNGGTHIYIMR